MIEPTLSLEQASSRIWDAVVVGAGPAGALAAGELARLGGAVLLVDRSAFPRWKVCGCCINPRAVAALATAGVRDLLHAAGALPLHSLCLAAGRRQAVLHLAGGVALSRSAFDAALVRSAITRGAAFLPSTNSALGESRTDRRTLQLQQTGCMTNVSARVILAADGLGGMLLGKAGIADCPALPGSRIGAGVIVEQEEAFYAPGTIYMTCGRVGYLGLVRLEDGRLDLACALDGAAVRRSGGPGNVAAELLRAAGWPVPDALERQRWRGTAALSRQSGRVVDHRLFALGDATGYVEPFTGEGIAWALASAVALAPLALQAARQWRPELARDWAEMHRRIVTRRQLAVRFLAAALRRPKLMTALVSVLARFPKLAVPVLRYLDHSDRMYQPVSPGRTLALRGAR